MRRPTVPEVLPLASAYLDAHPAGGSLHVVLDDGNLRDRDLEFCYRYAMLDPGLYDGHPSEASWRAQCENDSPDLPGAALALLLLSMTQTQRRKVYGSA